MNKKGVHEETEQKNERQEKKEVREDEEKRKREKMMAKHTKFDGMCHLSEKIPKDGTSQKPKLSPPKL